jgi:hypothetical protein
MNDWLKLLVKYKGKCTACNEEIPAGEYALWSKTSKAIRHIECKATITTKMKENDDTSAPRPAMAEVDCFICGKPIPHAHCGFAVEDYHNQAMSQACICNSCLEDGNAYQNYQEAFLKKAYKLTKVKLWMTYEQ